MPHQPGMAMEQARARVLEAAGQLHHDRWADPTGRAAGRAIPRGFFERPQVTETLMAWATGDAPLDMECLEREWARTPGHAWDVGGFYARMATFLALVRDPAYPQP